MIVQYRTRLIDLPSILYRLGDGMSEENQIKPKHDTNRMGTAPIGRTLAAMSWPAILSMSVNALYNVVDSIFVSKYDPLALTAVSLVMPIQLIMVAFTVGSGVGVNSVISRRLGAKNYEDANKAASISVRIGIFNYLIFLLIGVLLTVPFISHYTKNTGDTKVFEYGTTYMRLVLSVAIFSAVEVILQKVLQATGNMKGPMICSIAGCVTNIILDPILIFGYFGAPRLGVAGAAIATVFGQFIAFLLAVYFVKKQSVIKLKVLGFKMDWSVVRDIYAVSIPSIFMQMIGSVMLIGYNTILAGDNTSIAVLGVYQKLQNFVFMPVFGLNQGAMPLMGYNYGAKNKERLMKTYKLALGAAVVIMLIGFAVFQMIPKVFLKLFNAEGEMMTVGVKALRRISICFIPASFGIMTSTLFQGTGHAIYSLFSSLIRQLVGILPLAFILFRIGGAELSWFSFPLAEILGSTYLIIMLKRLYTKELKHL